MATAADGRRANGGARAGAGRKPAEARDELVRLLDRAVPITDRAAILVKLSDLAQAGDIKAAQLLLAYLYGRPVERQEIKTESKEPTRIVVEYADAKPQVNGDEE